MSEVAKADRAVELEFVPFIAILRLVVTVLDISFAEGRFQLQIGLLLWLLFLFYTGWTL